MLMHRLPSAYKKIHSTHHAMPTIRATDTIRHSFWDGSWDVACSVIALKLTNAHPISRMLYNITAIFLITEAHCGMNLPWGLHNLLPFNIMAGPVVHGIHHKSGKVNFQKYFTYLDWIFGTLQLS